MEELADLRARYPECSVVVFADLVTRTVLASSTRAPTTQENLDLLCLTARQCFDAPETGLVCAALNSQAASDVLVAWTSTPDALCCFVRAAPPSGEALCFRISDPSLLGKLSSDASHVLQQLIAEE